MLRTLAILTVVLVAIAGTVVAYGAYRWKQGTIDLRARLDAASVRISPHVVDFRELAGLPAPVQRYFRLVLKDGRPMVAGAHLRHEGTFNMGETSDQWKPFRSDQKVVTRRPGFDWDARIALMPGLTVRVHDMYLAGEGTVHASLLGLKSVADIQGAGAIAEGELMRFAAEAAWYPTALLPSQDVSWQAVDERSAYATLRDDAISVTMLFSFDEYGLMDTVGALARGRTVEGRIVPTPWQGRFWNYQDREGMVVPLDGEVAWLLPTGRKPYWRGHITSLTCDFDD